ncbi:adenyl-nucleotide exchange factor sse1 [Malassezia furfur]|uniref:Adenyl-nucleotide exchange factor sse1 n=1 Tax=Malassezia furfur TaxID=55194 RepID=A0ABY8EM21_MALFU|nr:SSE1 [Malassezia furfur]WFD46588.1 adenyl-nucleotide exchange factor sse1 [Malassezia furfur]
MSSVVGLDIGNSSSKIGVARARGVDIVANEVSNRSTPSLVSFLDKARAIGEAAATAQTSNFKNTVGSLKRLVGRTFDDEAIQNIEKKFIYAELVDAGGEVGVKVNYAGEQHVFSATQVLAMYLAKLRDTAQNELGGQTVSDVVFSVPIWFTDSQRRAMLAAAEIANLNPLRAINEPTATALGYGITKTDLPEPENPRNVVFVDIGHSNYQVSVVAFSKGQLTVLGASADPNFGGRNFDRALVEHFAEEFKGKYKIDVFSSPKAVFRLAAGCERLKKVLSANSLAQLNVESLMNDIDASSQLKREEFEELIKPYLENIEVPLNEALEQSGLTKDEIFSVELVGGSTRVPALKERIAAWFGKGLSTTLNADEAVVRGDTLACATLSPVFRVREFSVHDISPYPIKVSWPPAADVPDEENELVVFSKNNPVPSTKILTFYRKEPFTLEAAYADPAHLPIGTQPALGRVSIDKVAPNAQGDHSIVKVKARLNLHGVLNVESAYTVDEVEKEEEVPVEGAQQVEGEPVKTEKRVVKKLQRKDDLPIVSHISHLTVEQIAQLKEKEGQMHAADKLVADTEDRRNALEEYIYDQRSRLSERYAAFVQADEKEKYLAELSQAEDWLYTEEGEDATKSAYTSRLEALEKMGAPIQNRWKQNEERPKAASQLREVLNKYSTVFEQEPEKYDHLSDDDKTKVIEKVANVSKWLDDWMYKQSELPKNADPKLTVEDIMKNKDDVIYVVTPILAKPKPRAAPEAPKADANANAEGQANQEQADKQQGDMDVD